MIFLKLGGFDFVSSSRHLSFFSNTYIFSLCASLFLLQFQQVLEKLLLVSLKAIHKILNQV